MIDRRQRLGVMGGKLREDGICRRQQLAGAGDVGNVGMDLAGIDRKILKPLDLRALDLCIPIGALHQPHHDAAAVAASEINDEIENEGAALAIGLHHETHAFPACKVGIGAEAIEKIERKLQPIGLLGIDIETDIVGLGNDGERLHPRQKFVHHTRCLRARIARMKRRQLDRNAGPIVDAAARGRLADRMDRGLVILVIALASAAVVAASPSMS